MGVLDPPALLNSSTCRNSFLKSQTKDYDSSRLFFSNLEETHKQALLYTWTLSRKIRVRILQWALFTQQGSREHRRQRTALKPNTEGKNVCLPSGEEKRSSLFFFTSNVSVLSLFSRVAGALGSSLSWECASYTDITEHELFKAPARPWCSIPPCAPISDPF